MIGSYRKLPGKGRRSDGRFIGTHYASSRLWLGGDHLLMVDDVYTDQTIRRFQLRDIQQITVHKTRRYSAYNAVFGGLMLLSLLPALGVDDQSLRIFFFLATGLFFILLLINLFKGPTSKGFIVTAVHHVEIPSFGRLRNARKALGIIVPAIESAQGAFDIDAVEDRLAGTDEVSQAQPVRASLNPVLTPGSVAVRRKASHLPGTKRWHRFLYPCLFLDGVASLLSVFINNLMMVVGGFILFVAIALFSAMALARQDSSSVSRRLGTCTKVVLGYVIVGLVVGWVEYVAMLIPNPDLAAAQHEMFIHLAGLEPLEVPWLLAHLIAFGATSLILGLTGMTWLRDAPSIAKVQVPAAFPPRPPALPVDRLRHRPPHDAGPSTPPPVPNSTAGNE